MGASHMDNRWDHYTSYVKAYQSGTHSATLPSCGSGWLRIGIQVWASPRETCGYKLGTLNIQIQSISHY